MDFRQAGERIRRGEISNLYLFSGPDEYLKEELLQEIRFHLKKTGRHFSVEKVDAIALTDGLPGLIRELQQTTIQTSLLSEGRIIWVYNSPKIGKTAGDENAVTLWLGGSFSDTMLIFSVPQVDKRRKIVKVIENAGMLIEFPLLKGVALLKWLEGRLARENLQIEDDAARELVERTGENLTLLNNEIDKIKTYAQEEKKVSIALIRKLVPGSSQGNIFQLTDAIGRKDMDEAIKHLAGIKAQGEYPLIILAMIARQFRLLFQLSLLQNRDLSRREILAVLKVQPFLLNKLQDQVKNYTAQTLAQIITHLKETDAAIKGGKLDAEDALEQMILGLTV